MARTPVPVKMVTAPVRAIRGGGRGAGKDVAVRPSAELVEIRQLRREMAALGGGDTAQASDEADLSGWLYRHRRQVAPFYAAAVLAASKVLVMGPSFLPAVGLAALLVLAAGAVLWVRACSPAPWRNLLDAVPEDVRPWLGKVTSPRAAAVMAAVCSLYWWVRPTDFQEAAWAWGGGVLVAVAARAYRFRIRPTGVIAEPTTGPAEEWDLYVATNEKAAEGSRIATVHPVINPQGDPIGFAMDGLLPQGSKGATAVLPSLRGRVASTYRVGVQDVMLQADRRDDSRFTVTVLNVPGANALDQVHVLDGPSDFDPATGIWTQAIRADWTPARVCLFDVAGARHGHVSGETGGGKSETVETILRSVTQHGVVTPIIIDLGEATFVDWQDRVPVFVTTPEDAILLLRNVMELHKQRMRELATMRNVDDTGDDLGPRRVYPIDRDHPLVLVVFDEWQFAVNHPQWGQAFLRATEDIVTQTRKTGISMLLAGQATGLVSGFKNSQIVRTQCQAGYMIAHRNNNESGTQAFGKSIQVDPSVIPSDIKGACYLVSNVDARDAMARSLWTNAPARLNHLLDVGQLPEQHLDILRADLFRTLLREGLVKEGLTQDAAGELAGTLTAPPPATPVDAAPSDALMDAIEFWLAEVGDWTQRKDVVSEFKDGRGMASSTKIDAALKRLREREIVEAEDGKYRARVRTTQ